MSANIYSIDGILALDGLPGTFNNKASKLSLKRPWQVNGTQQCAI